MTLDPHCPLESISARIQELVRSRTLPAELRAELASAREALGGALAVRSSAVGEDSQEASFAGQLGTVLSVQGKSALEEALLTCWASYWSPRALFYQRARGVRLRGMGVVIQRMVDAQISGVLFTRAPGRRPSDELVGEYCFGLGDGLVSGAINPGRFNISREELRTTRVAVPETDGDASALFERGGSIELARHALALEEHFGGPQDIEWTIDTSGRLFLLQSRPITASTPAPELHWSNANVNENFPEPISPLLHSIARDGYYHYFRNLGLALGVSPHRIERMEHSLRHLVGVHGARLYYNLTHLEAVLAEAPGGDVLTGYFRQFVGIGEEDRPENPPVRSPTRARELARIAVHTTRLYARLPERVARFERRADAFAERTHPARLAGKNLPALLEDLRAFCEIRFRQWVDASLADTAAMVCYGVLNQLVRGAFPGEREGALHNNLLKGIPDVVSSRPVEDLWALSRTAAEDPGLRELFASASGEDILAAVRRAPQFSAFRRELDTYLENWGFRGSGELMLTVPSYQERPAELLELLKAYLTAEGPSPGSLILEQERERARETERVLEALSTRPLSRWLPFVHQAHLARWILGWTHASIRFRERVRLKQALLYSRLRRVALAIGARLTERGVLGAAEDVFFLTWQELDDWLAGSALLPHAVGALVALRKQEHARHLATRPPDTVRLFQGEYLPLGEEAPPPERAAPAEELSGLATCGGRVTGRAMVMKDMSEASRLEAGDVLVTRQTDPGWAPAFFLIKGLVMERGGMLSHGAIIAREFGIPAVVDVRGATERIQPGQTVSVDGDRGRVQVHG